MGLNRNLCRSRIINCFLNILIFILSITFLISVYSGVQTKILGHNYNNFFGYAIFEVETGSMAGTINIGDWIIVKLTTVVNVNDIITYELDGNYVTHRLVSKYKNAYITKGDANGGKDDPIKSSQIVGKVVNILPHLGLLRKTLFNPAVLIAIIITLFLFEYALRKKKQEREKIDKDMYWYLNLVVEKISLFVDRILKKTYSKGEEVIKKKILEQDDLLVTKEEPKPLETTTNHYQDEDELAKTSLYRVISVTEDGKSKQPTTQITKAEVEDYYKDEDELDKTALYRVIAVDASEVDQTLLEIAQNELSEPKLEVQTEVTMPKVETETGGENLTQLNLELIKGEKKAKNLIDLIMATKKTELEDLIMILGETDPSYIRRVGIRNDFITTYIEAQYYNYYKGEGRGLRDRRALLKVEAVLKDQAQKMIKASQSKNPKQVQIIKQYLEIILLVAKLDQAQKAIKTAKAQQEFYKKVLSEYRQEWAKNQIESVVTAILKRQKEYEQGQNQFWEQLETNMFNLELKQLKANKEMYAVNLEHNLKFSKVYSDYIIDKTYTEGVIAEDKISILFTLLAKQLVTDLFSSNYKTKYLFYLPPSLYKKERKLQGLLKMMTDRFALTKTIILITFTDLVEHYQVIKKLRKKGFSLGLVLNKEIKTNKKTKSYINVVSYVFLNKSNITVPKVKTMLPEELLNKIIPANLTVKITDLEGE